MPYAEVYKTLELSPPKTRSETLETLVSLFLEAASHSPVVLEVEDLHWIDPSTLELLGLLLERIAMVPLFLLLTARPELEVSWSSHAALERITLAPLDPQASAELIDHLVEERRKTLGDRDHDAERPQPLLDELLRQRIIERSDGVPLFLEEVTKALLETELSDAGLIRATSDSSTTIPAIPLTLQGSLAARLDRLGTAKEVAQLAAVVGREVPWDQLLAISPIPEDELERDLERLVRAEILWRRDARERRRYIFRHSLLRDAAYSSLLQRERRDLHRRLAGYLAEGVSETGAVPLELLAHHCAAGGDHENAVLYWFQAAERAIARSANQEGITHLRRGLEILHDLPRGVERDQLELRFLSRLGAALAITRGYSAPQVEEVYGRAEALCRDLGETLQLFWVVWGLWSFHLVRARIGLAGRLAEQLVRIAEKEGDVQHILVALSCLGHVHYFSGDLAAARGALERALELDAAQREHPLTSPSGQDIGVTVRSLLALVLWHFGEDTAAVRQNDAALALARRLAHPLSVAFALIYGARLHQTRRDVRRTRKMAREAVDLSRDKGFFWVAQGIFFQGCARVETSRELSSPGREATLTGAIGLVRRGLDAYSAAGACLSRTYMLAQLAESELLSGHFAEAREILAEADELLARGDEHFWAAEIRRLAGEIAWAEGSRSDAETAYREALEIALRRGDAALASRARESLEAAEDAE